MVAFFRLLSVPDQKTLRDLVHLMGVDLESGPPSHQQQQQQPTGGPIRLGLVSLLSGELGQPPATVRPSNVIALKLAVPSLIIA